MRAAVPFVIALTSAASAQPAEPTTDQVPVEVVPVPVPVPPPQPIATEDPTTAAQPIVDTAPSTPSPGDLAPTTQPVPSRQPVPEPRATSASAQVGAGGMGGFRFGSYGRAVAGTDLRGGKPEKLLVVARGPRVVEQSYLELDFSYGFDTERGLKLRPVVTLAFNGTLFHETGVFDAQPALRNVFLEAQLTKNVSAWGGSRMYRGDDIYLFDYWPLDDLNTVGGGVYYRKAESESGKGNALELAAHAGFNRLLNPFTFQEVDVPDPEQGATTIVQLNRQRMVASATGAYLVDGGPGNVSIKLKVHGEVHALPSGTRRREADATFEELPSDTGFLVGGQVSLFGFSNDPRHRNHLNLYARYAKGLAAFDELAPPTSFGSNLEVSNANEIQLGASGALDHKLGNVMLGAVTRRFVDADGNETDPDDGWEYSAAVRPLANVGAGFFAGADLSYQARFPRGLNPITLRAEDPAIFQVAPMIVYSPMGPSAYDRPQLRLVYRAARLNEAARNLYVPDDPRHDRTWVHFLGIQAEWWFNSSTYR